MQAVAPLSPVDERVCRGLSRRFYAPGYDQEDMLQEARLAAWLAPAPIRGLAAKRRLMNIVTVARRKVTFAPLHDVVDGADVVELVAARLELRRILSAPLSPLQQQAVGRAFRGEGCTDKRMDNALQVAKRKLAA